MAFVLLLMATLKDMFTMCSHISYFESFWSGLVGELVKGNLPYRLKILDKVM